MANFKPQVTFTTRESMYDYVYNCSNSQYVVKSFKTYRELIKKLPDILEDSLDDYVSVVRSKRGEFGEWFEHWQLNSSNKPIIINQGWN